MNTDSLTKRIISAAFKVSNTLGAGFLEKVYENALTIELKKGGLNAKQQATLRVHYEGIVVGDYVADLIVESLVVVEIKAARTIDPAHTAQILNYLRAGALRTGLILNFGTSKIGIRRFVI